MQPQQLPAVHLSGLYFCHRRVVNIDCLMPGNVLDSFAVFSTIIADSSLAPIDPMPLNLSWLYRRR